MDGIFLIIDGNILNSDVDAVLELFLGIIGGVVEVSPLGLYDGSLDGKLIVVKVCAIFNLTQ